MLVNSLLTYKGYFAFGEWYTLWTGRIRMPRAHVLIEALGSLANSIAYGALELPGRLNICAKDREKVVE